MAVLSDIRNKNMTSSMLRQFEKPPAMFDICSLLGFTEMPDYQGYEMGLTNG